MVSEHFIIPHSRVGSHRLLARGLADWLAFSEQVIGLLEAAREPVQLGSCCICIPGSCNPWAAWQASPGNTCVRGCSWDGRTCRAGDDYFSWSLAALLGRMLSI